MEGDFIVPGQDGGGFRDFLAGEPLSAGTLIDLWTVNGWLPGRYEANFSQRRGFFFSRAFDPTGQEEIGLHINRPIMRFRRAR